MKRHLFTATVSLVLISSSSALANASAQPNPIVKTVIVTGDTYFSFPTVIAHLAVRPGMRFSNEIEGKDAESIRTFYETHGLQLGNIAGGIDPASVDAKSDTATVKYAINIARVAAVHITGDVNEAQVRKMLTVQPGMPVDVRRVKADEERLRATGQFRQINVSVVPGPNPNKPEDITLVWVLRRR